MSTPLAVFFLSLAAFLLIARLLTQPASSASEKVDRYLREGDTESPDSFRDRILSPVWGAFKRTALKIYPPHILKMLDTYCMYAGYPMGITGEILAGTKVFFAMLCGALGAVFSTGRYVFPVAFLMIFFGYAFPGVLMQRRIKLRREHAERQLTDAIDLLVVSVEAGLGLDAAMKRVADKIGGPIGEAFSGALYEIALGESREAAFRGIYDRIPIQEVGQFTGSIIQAEQLGVSIGKVLRTQAGMLRRKRRLKAEEHARKAPIKILFPLVLFIFPSLFVVILGPAIINIIQEFILK